MKRQTVAGFAWASMTFICMAQTPPPAGNLKFEVASIKAGQSPIEMMRAGRMPAAGTVFSGSRVEIGSSTMKNLIVTAYGLDPQHVTAPAWTTTTYFTLQAIMPAGATKEQFPQMLQALLAERFHLTVKRNTVDQPGYALTVAKGGHKMKVPSEVDRSGCDTWNDDRQFPGAKTCNFVLNSDDGRTTVTIRTDSKTGPVRTSLSRRASDTEFFGITMPQLAEYLEGVVISGPNRATAAYVPILDRTELPGKWHVMVERAFEDAALSPADGPVIPVPITPTLIANELNIGLSKVGIKLEKITAPVEMLVVEKLDQTPVEN